MKIGPIGQFIIIGVFIGTLMPFVLAMCLFGTTLQNFVKGGGPTPGYWSGAPTAAPTPVPSEVQVWTNETFSAAGGAVFLLWSIVGAFAGEGVAMRRWARGGEAVTRKAGIGALAGSLIFIAVAVCGFLR